MRDEPHLIWTIACKALLESLWAQHEIPVSEIGKRLGVSTSAATCKAHRMKLPARPSPVAGGRPRGIAERAKRKHVAAAVPVFTGATPSQPPPQAKPPMPAWMSLPTGPAKACQFPLWAHRTEAPKPALFCGAPTTFGSWCAEHALVVFTPTFRKEHANDTA